METKTKKWRDTNKDKVKLQKKREKIRFYLRKHNILPPVGESLNDEQNEILEQISNNDFSFYLSFKENKKQHTIEKNKVQQNKLGNKKSRLLYELRKIGILPTTDIELNDEQEKIIKYIYENNNIPIKSFISKYYSLTSPEWRMWYKKKNDKVFDFNLDIEDIIIPTHCPYLGIELSTNFDDRNNPHYYSLDRIDSSKGYVKGNVQVISLMANIMKNNASKDQLIVFAKNILKLHDF